MKNTMKLFMLVAFVFSTFAASAQTAIKLGHVDLQAILVAMPEFKRAEESIQAKMQEAQKEFENLQSNFQKAYEEFQQGAQTMSDLVRASKEQELYDMQQRIQSFANAADQNITETRNQLMQPIMEKIFKAVEDVGKENGFTYIFTQEAILFAASNSTDVADLVKRKLGI